MHSDRKAQEKASFFSQRRLGQAIEKENFGQISACLSQIPDICFQHKELISNTIKLCMDQKIQEQLTHQLNEVIKSQSPKLRDAKVYSPKNNIIFSIGR